MRWPEPARRHAAGCRRWAAAAPSVSRRGCATISCAAASPPASLFASCAKRAAWPWTSDQKRAEQSAREHSPHAPARVAQFVDDAAVATDRLRAAEVVERAAPLIDVLVAERLVPRRTAKRRAHRAPLQRATQKRVDLLHQRL